jgi:hypothetical protein
MHSKNVLNYSTPLMEIIELVTEGLLNQSTMLEDPVEREEIGWN